MRINDSKEKPVQFYNAVIVRLHIVPFFVVSDRDLQFTSKFWQSLQAGLGMELWLSTTYHTQTDGQSEKTIQILVDMLKAYVMNFVGNWEDHLLLVEFAYNNRYQTSI